ASTAEYAKDEADLRRLLLQSGIDLNSVRDPWGMAFRPVFWINKQYDVLNLESAGADKRFDTDDDLIASQQSWPYFRSLGETIDKAVRRYHSTTGGFIRDFATLRNETAKDDLHLDQLRDRWGQLYRFNFEVNNDNYVIRVVSGGPDKQFAAHDYTEDDFI